jgi:hypothetical protein
MALTFSQATMLCSVIQCDNEEANMSEATPAEVECSGCHRRFRWKPELAGRAAKCPCGAVMRFPQSPPLEEELYSVAPAPLPSAQLATAKPAAPAEAQPVKSARRGRVLAYQGKSDSDAVDAYFPEKIKDLYMPLVLLCAGILVQFVAGWWAGARWGIGPSHAMTQVGVEMVLGTILMLAAIFIAAKRRGFTFGPFWGAVLKLSAVSIAPSALMTLLDIFLRIVPLGGLITWVLGFCFYFALIGAFFDLDQSDTWYCVCVIFLVKLMVALGVLWMVSR